MCRYLSWFVVSSALSLAVLAAINVVIDPYGAIWGVTSKWPVERVLAVDFPYVSKPAAFSLASPETIVFGNSRAAYGFDPLRPDWPSSLGSGFNYGIPSARLKNMQPYLNAALATTSPRRIVIGVDFFYDWLTPWPNSELPPRWIRALAEKRSLWQVALARQIDSALMIISITTLRDSIMTLMSQRRKSGSGIYASGFSAQVERACAKGCDAGRDATEVFKAKFRNYRVKHLRTRGPNDTPPDNPNLKALDEMISAARERGVEVTVIFYPYHSTMLDLIDQSGYWPDFLEWKRAIVSVVGGHKDGDVRMLDFSIISPYSEEAMPRESAETQALQWYFDPGHFRPALGSLILACIAEQGAPCFGEQLSADTIDRQIIRQQRDFEVWRQRNSSLDSIISAIAQDKSIKSAAKIDFEGE